MHHNELMLQGFEDDIGGTESYAVSYMRGVLFSNDIVAFKDINGSEGLVGAIWEKIKQFCAWFVGLFTGKKEVGVATAEVGVKPSMPVKKEEIKVTPVKAAEIKPAEPAPKAHVPTPEQKKSDKVTMAVVEKPNAPAEPAKEVVLVTKPHNLEYLFKSLRKQYLVFKEEIESLVQNYGIVFRLRDELGEKFDSAFTGFTKMSVADFEGHFKSVMAEYKAWENVPDSFSSVTVENITSLANSKITKVCTQLLDLTKKLKLVPAEITNKDLTKEKLYSFFESHIKNTEDQHEREKLCKVLTRYMRFDYQFWGLLETSDALARTKEDILNGNYFVRAPQ